MKEEGQLDLTSDGFVGPPKPTSNPKPRRIRIFFTCCKVYAQLTVPDRLVSREMSSWRIHCPRCARAVEIRNP